MLVHIINYKKYRKNVFCLIKLWSGFNQQRLAVKFVHVCLLILCFLQLTTWIYILIKKNSDMNSGV